MMKRNLNNKVHINMYKINHKLFFLSLQVFLSLACSPGKYLEGQYCKSCPGGYKCSGSTQPVACGPGTYSNSDGNSKCSNCSKGYYCNRTINTFNP